MNYNINALNIFFLQLNNFILFVYIYNTLWSNKLSRTNMFNGTEDLIVTGALCRKMDPKIETALKT